MNDPHVVALIYVVEHEESVDYGSAETVEEERSTFRLTLQDGEARFELKEDYASTPTSSKGYSTVHRAVGIEDLACLRPRQFRLEV